MTETMGMPVRLSIGDFSRMTHLSVKALRHYHELGLLVPAQVDEDSGYRYYQPGQVATAQVIRRLRDLGMPLDEIRAVLTAPDLTARNEVFMAHLDRMTDQLAQTQATVTSMRQLLDPQPTQATVEYRSVPATPALAVTATVTTEGVLDWWSEAFEALHQTLAKLKIKAAGPDGVLFPGEYYQLERANLVAFIPLHDPISDRSARVVPYTVPPAELAIAVHHGSLTDIDRTYGQLGIHVATAAIGIDGPIREHYLVTYTDTPDETQHRTEVAWPVFRTTPALGKPTDV